MYSNIDFRDAYLKIYENLNESSTLAAATKKASQSPTAFSSGVSLSPSPSAASTYKLKPSASSTLASATKKAAQSPTAFSSGVSSSSTSTKSEPSASSPEASKPSPFKSAKELSDLRSASARATMAGPSKEAQELMSPRTKRISSGKSVYNNLPGRENMVSRNIERAKSSETPSPSTTPSTSSSTSSSTTSKPTPRVVQTSTATSRQPLSSTTYSRPSVSTPLNLSFGYRGRTKKVSNTIVKRNVVKNVGKRINKEAFEFWVNTLLGEGYDLSEYTWDDMYEMYEDYKTWDSGLADSYTSDLFDTILDYLVSEGYADTNEAAIAIMANMSEEWRDSIVEATYGGTKATDTPADKPAYKPSGGATWNKGQKLRDPRAQEIYDRMTGPNPVKLPGV
jgi:hypothetical protein